MEWITASVMTIGSDLTPAVMSESEGIRFCPVFKLTCDGAAIDAGVHTRLRWEHRNLTRAAVPARVAMAGRPLSESLGGSWPFMDLVLEDPNSPEPFFHVGDQDMCLIQIPLKPPYWEAVYKLKGKGQNHRSFTALEGMYGKQGYGRTERRAPKAPA